MSDSIIQTHPCISARLTGEECEARCELEVVTDCADGDECCAEGCTHETDSDCAAGCGNGMVDENETCDPSASEGPSCPVLSDCVDGKPCTRDLLLGQASGCSAQCANPPITELVAGDRCCPEGANNNIDTDCVPMCGNGVVERDELRDGSSDCDQDCRRIVVSCSDDCGGAPLACCDNVCVNVDSSCFPWPCIPGTTADNNNCGGCGTLCPMFCCRSQ